ncbi:transcription antitermination factor NusB [Auraticoccus sp. F435]|uniref:Transcription antitermination protein NusB n=1 Tax=Auraticoccus cholistanensis TaxID=2656650 RepID=A0A6A9UXD7_9ACTN|nr:transcription antitermination factor NusB [Auraticoccus cholistanensis]
MPRTRLSPRSKARKRAVDILFEAELRGADPKATLAERAEAADPPVRDFTTELVLGVDAHRPVIDRRISEVLRSGWSLERMPRVDRAVARLAVYELDFTDIQTSVAVSEAVALAQDLSTDESPAFLNGVLSAIAADRTGGPTPVDPTPVEHSPGGTTPVEHAPGGTTTRAAAEEA